MPYLPPPSGPSLACFNRRSVTTPRSLAKFVWPMSWSRNHVSPVVRTQKLSIRFLRSISIFLLCNNGDLSVACAIELDDASHNSKRRQERDEFLKGACEAAGIQLIQVPAQPRYVIEEVKRLLPRNLVASKPVDGHKTIAQSSRKPETKGKVCPNCSAPMLKKVAKRGSHAGQMFWACSAFPNCKTVEAIGVR